MSSWRDYPDAGLDEAVHGGAPTALSAGLLAAADALGTPALAARAGDRDARQRELGMTFALPDAGDRLFPMDLLPRLVARRDWELLAAGLEQRARALNALITDAYGERAAVRDGIIPGAVVADPGESLTRHPGGPPPATVAGMDLLREADGSWRVLEDNLRVPSGIGYAMLAREVSTAVVPELGPPTGVLDPAPATDLLRRALDAGAPPRCAGSPAVAVLSSGPVDSAYAEHRLLADRMGVPLVTPAQLRVQADGGLHAPSGRVDVLYRRVDHHELGAQTLADGEPALPALGAAVAAGTLTLANALGCGMADDKAVYAFVPRLIRYYLDEQPLLADVPTYVLTDAEHREQALDRLGELVAKPVDGYGGRGVTFGASLSAAGLDALRAELLAAPHRWVAQQPIAATTVPTLVDGGWTPCCVDLRAFVVSGAVTTALPALLSRVAAPGSRIVNSSQGGGCKDTWVLP